jgi:hypothetical protein
MLGYLMVVLASPVVHLAALLADGARAASTATLSGTGGAVRLMMGRSAADTT